MSKKRLDLQMFADASAQLQNTTGAAGMTAEMKTYYEKTLLDLAEAMAKIVAAESAAVQQAQRV